VFEEPVHVEIFVQINRYFSYSLQRRYCILVKRAFLNIFVLTVPKTPICQTREVSMWEEGIWAQVT
jgi:hypothetical protein